MFDEGDRDHPLRGLYCGMGRYGHVAVYAALMAVLRRANDRETISGLLRTTWHALRDIPDFDPDERNTLRITLIRRLEESHDPGMLVRFIERLPDITLDERAHIERLKLQYPMQKVA